MSRTWFAVWLEVVCTPPTPSHRSALPASCSPLAWSNVATRRAAWSRCADGPTRSSGTTPTTPSTTTTPSSSQGKTLAPQVCKVLDLLSIEACADWVLVSASVAMNWVGFKSGKADQETKRNQSYRLTCAHSIPHNTSESSPCWLDIDATFFFHYFNFFLACGEKTEMFAVFFLVFFLSNFCSALIQFWKSAAGTRKQWAQSSIILITHVCGSWPPTPGRRQGKRYRAVPYMSGQRFLTPPLSFSTSAREQEKKRKKKNRTHTPEPETKAANKNHPCSQVQYLSV